jgi:hypothetical protein
MFVIIVVWKHDLYRHINNICGYVRVLSAINEHRVQNLLRNSPNFENLCTQSEVPASSCYIIDTSMPEFFKTSLLPWSFSHHNFVRFSCLRICKHISCIFHFIFVYHLFEFLTAGCKTLFIFNVLYPSFRLRFSWLSSGNI